MSAVAVRFQRLGQVASSTVSTDADGRYSIDLPPGEYSADLGFLPDSAYHPGITGFEASADVARVLDLEAQWVQQIEDFVIAGETTVLDSARAETVEVSSDGVTLSVPIVAGAEAIEAGDILASGVTQSHPGGLLRRVVTSSMEGGTQRLGTEWIPIEQAIVDGEFSFEADLDLSLGGTFTPNVPGAEPIPALQTPEGIFFSLDDTPVYDHDGSPGTTEDQIRVSGHISISRFRPIANEKITNSAPERARWGAEVENEVLLKIDWGSIGASVGWETLVGTIELGWFVIEAGIPVVVIPQLEVIVGVEGEIHLGVTTGLNVLMDAGLGFEFSDQGPSPWGYFSQEVSVLPVTVSAGGGADVYVRTPVVFLIYALAGPYFGLRVAADFSADVAANPWWELGLGVSTQAGFKPNEKLNKILSLPEFEIPVRAGVRTVVRDAGGPFVLPNESPTAAITSPAGGSSFAHGSTVTFEGTGSDPEDGMLTGSSLVWTSNSNGLLGTGTSLPVTTLPVGEQLITLTATDSEGA
ncbi:hypothetical protein ACFL3Z_02115, partial [Gemmatimonadota bacterium]